MPQQTLPQVRVVDPILTTHVQGYRNAEMAADALFPRVPVQISGGRVLEFGKESFKLYSTLRAPGTDARRVRFGYEGKPYALDNHALDAVVPREHLRDAAVMPGIDLAARSVNLVQKSNLLTLEKESADLAIDANNYDANHKVTLAGATKWSDAAGLPTKNIDDAREAVRATTGVYPNVVLLSAVAFKAAKNNPSVLDRFKYTSRDSVTPEMLAALWDVERVVVGRAVYASDAGAFTDVWGNNAVVAYVPPVTSGMEEPSYGYTYTMEGHPMVEEPYWDNKARSWIYGVTYERKPVLTGILAGYLIIAPN